MGAVSAAVHHAIAAAFRDEWGRIVATPIGTAGDWDLAEDCAWDAFAQALPALDFVPVTRQAGRLIAAPGSGRSRGRG